SWFDDNHADRVYSTVPVGEVVNVEIPLLFTEELNPGWHRVYFRMRDDQGVWSAVVYRNFFQPISSSPNKMTMIRYWTDQESGINVPSDLTYLSFSDQQQVST